MIKKKTSTSIKLLVEKLSDPSFIGSIEHANVHAKLSFDIIIGW